MAKTLFDYMEVEFKEYRDVEIIKVDDSASQSLAHLNYSSATVTKIISGLKDDKSVEDKVKKTSKVIKGAGKVRAGKLVYHIVKYPNNKVELFNIYRQGFEKTFQIPVKKSGREIKNYFFLSQIELNEYRIEMLVKQLTSGTGRCSRVTNVPVLKEYADKGSYTGIELLDVDFVIKTTQSKKHQIKTVVYLLDCLMVAKELAKTYLDKIRQYRADFLEKESDIPIERDVKYKDFYNYELKLLNDAVMHLSHVGPKKFSPVLINVLNVLHVTGRVALGTTVWPSALFSLKSGWKEFDDWCRNYSFYKAKLRPASKEQKGEMPDDCPYSNGWTESDWWSMKYFEQEFPYIEAYFREGERLALLLKKPQFSATLNDYQFFGTKEQREQCENDYLTIIENLHKTPSGKSYLSSILQTTKDNLAALRRAIAETSDERIKSIVGKEGIDLSDEERRDFLKFAYRIHKEDNWWSSRILPGIGTVSTVIMGIVGALSMVIDPKETAVLEKYFNIPDMYFLHYGTGGSSTSFIDIAPKDFVYDPKKYAESFKSMVDDKYSAEVYSQIEKDIKEMKSWKNKVSDAYDKNELNKVKSRKKEVSTRKRKLGINVKTEESVKYSLSFQVKTVKDVKNNIKEQVVYPRILESQKVVKRENWAKKFQDHKAVKSFTLVCQTLQLATLIYEISEEDDLDGYAIYSNGMQMGSALAGLTEAALSFGIYDEVAGKAAVVANAFEIAHNGGELVKNAMELDADVALVYLACLASNFTTLAMVFSSTLATGPLGAFITVGLIAANVIAGQLIKYLDNDDYEDWLTNCLWGDFYGSKIPRFSIPSWTEKTPFNKWENNLIAQMEAYRELLNDYKINLELAKPTRKYPLCLINVTISPKAVFTFSEFKYSIFINDKEISKDNYINFGNAAFDITKKDGKKEIKKIVLPIIDTDPEGAQRKGLENYDSESGSSGGWLQKADKNRFEIIDNISNNDINERFIAGELKIVLELDIYNNGTLVLKREKKLTFRYDPYLIPTILKEEDYQKNVSDRIYRAYKDSPSQQKTVLREMESKYIAKSCPTCAYKPNCYMRKLTRKDLSCRRLLGAASRDEYKAMSRQEKDKIRRILSDINYYYTFTTADPGIESIY